MNFWRQSTQRGDFIIDFDLILYVPVNTFSYVRTGLPQLNKIKQG